MMAPDLAMSLPQVTRVIDDGRRQWIVRRGAHGYVMPADTCLGTLLAMSSTELRSTIETALASPPMEHIGRPCAPVDDDTEIWAAGVTYEVSRSARMDESSEATIYERVYDADRPELFFKAVGWRVAGPDQPIGVRSDSAWNVPEPELALVVNAHQEIVGFTVCNDVSSRSIEAENPLYLPQAKCYRGSCAIGPGIVPAWFVEDPSDLSIRMQIESDGAQVWSGSTSTRLLHRGFDELVDHLFRGDVFPRGVIVSTGTAAVPPADFTLSPGDTVTIAIDAVGTLRNTVLGGVGDAGWDQT